MDFLSVQLDNVQKQPLRGSAFSEAPATPGARSTCTNTPSARERNSGTDWRPDSCRREAITTTGPAVDLLAVDPRNADHDRGPSVVLSANQAEREVAMPKFIGTVESGFRHPCPHCRSALGFHWSGVTFHTGRH